VKGTYSILDKVIMFDFGANELGTGTLRRDSLYVSTTRKPSSMASRTECMCGRDRKGERGMNNRIWMGLIVLIAVIGLGCSEDLAGPQDPGDAEGPNDVPDPSIVFKFELEADRCEWVFVFPVPCVPVGESASIQVTVLTLDGDTLLGQLVTFTSEDEDVITVSTDGLVTAVGLGYVEVGVHVADKTQTISVLTLAWLPISGSALVYEEVGADPGELLLRSGEVRSRYVLHEDGTFGLQTSAGTDFRGTYSSEGSTIRFDFDGANWLATGTLRGDSLSVEYNDAALLADFQNGVYVLNHGTASSSAGATTRH